MIRMYLILGWLLSWGTATWSSPEFSTIEPNIFRILTHGDAANSGSGFLIRGTHLMVTNRHVVDGEGEIFVVISQQQRTTLLPASIYRLSTAYDIALLAVDNLSGPGLLLSSGIHQNKGQQVWAIGYPQAADRGRAHVDTLEATLTAGIINRTIHQPWEENGPSLSLIQHDAKTSHGNSGGPLVDECGHVIGVNTQIELATQALETYSYALSVADLRTLLDRWGIFYETANDRCAVQLPPPVPSWSWWLGGAAIGLATLTLALVLWRFRSPRVIHVVESYSRYMQRMGKSRSTAKSDKDSDTLPLTLARVGGERTVTLTLRRDQQPICQLQCWSNQDYQQIVGRSQELCDQVIEEETISRNHIRLSWNPQQQQWYLEDLNSKNGSWLDNRPLTPHNLTPIYHGAHLRLGELPLTIELTD